MRLHCPFCKAFSMCSVLAEHNEYDQECSEHYRTMFCKCPGCGSALLAVQDVDPVGDDDGVPRRLWPPPAKTASWQVPKGIGQALEEAQRCMENECYTAAGIMCRKALDLFCQHHQATGKDLFHKIDALHKAGVIDQRLKAWADALREDGNFAAHEASTTIAEPDARDMVEFAWAFVDYAFVLAERFKEYSERHENRKAAKGAKKPPKVPPKAPKPEESAS